MSKITNAFAAGRDYALNGANTDNCNFKWFSRQEWLIEWERGRDSITPPKSKESK